MTASKKIGASVSRRDLAFLNSYMEQDRHHRTVRSMRPLVFREKLLEEALPRLTPNGTRTMPLLLPGNRHIPDGLENED